VSHSHLESTHECSVALLQARLLVKIKLASACGSWHASSEAYLDGFLLELLEEHHLHLTGSLRANTKSKELTSLRDAMQLPILPRSRKDGIRDEECIL